MTKRITVTEGLKELTLLQDRISKALLDASFLAIQVGDKDINGHIKVEDFEKRAKSALQSVQKLISNRNSIKSAIVKSNAETFVMIGKNEYTVAEAIERKNSIANDKALLNTIRTQYNSITSQLERLDRTFTDELNRKIEATVGKETKGREDEVEIVTKSYTKISKPKLIDPLKALDLISDMTKEIEEFESQVDIRLNIINATTFIEIDE